MVEISGRLYFVLYTVGKRNSPELKKRLIYMALSKTKLSRIEELVKMMGCGKTVTTVVPVGGGLVEAVGVEGGVESMVSVISGERIMAADRVCSEERVGLWIGEGDWGGERWVEETREGESWPEDSEDSWREGEDRPWA